MKVLFVATVMSHIGHFHMPFIRKLKEHGVEVHAAYKDNSEQKKGLDVSAIDRVFEVPFSRSPYSFSNIKAYIQLKQILRENQYDDVHCHTPMGAVVARLAAKAVGNPNCCVIYTAHGFHFYRGASWKNWLLFYPVEKYLARYTDCLITINQEDYDLAVRKCFQAKRIEKVHGVGVDTDIFATADMAEKKELRREFGFAPDEFIMVFPSDLRACKNQMMLLETVAVLRERGVPCRLLLPGSDEQAASYIAHAQKLGVEKYIEIMGYRRDIDKLVALSDVSVSSSCREGLPINLIEAMAIGNPIVATDVRGNRDLVQEGVNGFLVPLHDVQRMADAIEKLYRSPELMAQFSQESRRLVAPYAVAPVLEEMTKIYKELSLL